MLIEKRHLPTFVLITSLFALWGFANDITNPMVAAFGTTLELSNFKAALVQFAFYGGYATMALPAALFIRRYSYKRGILLGLSLYAVGAFLFIPSAAAQSFTLFCLSLYVLTFGLAFLETTANPYILSLGSRSNATRRLNLAQAFNPVGSLMGMVVASQVVLSHLQSNATAVRRAYGVADFSQLSAPLRAAIREHDLLAIRDPYVAIGLVVVGVLLAIALFVRSDEVDQPTAVSSSTPLGKGALRAAMRRLWHDPIYREGVVAQMCYVAAQIMCWTFIIQYALRLGLEKDEAQWWNIGAMALCLLGRFAGTALMRRTDARRLLTLFALCAVLTCAGTILIDGLGGLCCLVATSAFMSIMFPTIYGVALDHVAPEDVSVGSAFLVMAIVGGAVMPPLQGAVIDLGTVLGWPAENVSFILPLLCFGVVALYGRRSLRAKP